MARISADARELEAADHRALDSGRVQHQGRLRDIEIEPAGAVISFGDRAVLVPTQADIDRERVGETPIVLNVETPVRSLLGKRRLEPDPPAVHESEQHARNRVALRPSVEALASPVPIELVKARRVRWTMVGDAVEPKHSSELDRVIAEQARHVAHPSVGLELVADVPERVVAHLLEIRYLDPRKDRKLRLTVQCGRESKRRLSYVLLDVPPRVRVIRVAVVAMHHPPAQKVGIVHRH